MISIDLNLDDSIIGRLGDIELHLGDAVVIILEIIPEIDEIRNGGVFIYRRIRYLFEEFGGFIYRYI